MTDHLVVKPLKDDQENKSGIVLPETADKEKSSRGQVMAIGDGRILDNGNRLPMTVKVDDKIIFRKYGGDEVKIDNEEYLILTESDVLAIVE